MTDLVETAFYITEDDPELPDRFLDAFEEKLEDIRRTPKIGSISRFRDWLNVRMWFVRGFRKSLIFYTENADEIVILHVVHSARDYNRFFDAD